HRRYRRAVPGPDDQARLDVPAPPAPALTGWCPSPRPPLPDRHPPLAAACPSPLTPPGFYATVKHTLWWTRVHWLDGRAHGWADTTVPGKNPAPGSEPVPNSAGVLP